MTVLKWTIFFKKQSFEHDHIIYNFVALSVSLCFIIGTLYQTYKHKKDVQNVFGAYDGHLQK